MLRSPYRLFLFWLDEFEGYPPFERWDC